MIRKLRKPHLFLSSLWAHCVRLAGGNNQNYSTVPLQSIIVPCMSPEGGCKTNSNAGSCDITSWNGRVRWNCFFWCHIHGSWQNRWCQCWSEQVWSMLPSLCHYIQWLCGTSTRRTLRYARKLTLDHNMSANQTSVAVPHFNCVIPIFTDKRWSKIIQWGQACF